MAKQQPTKMFTMRDARKLRRLLAPPSARRRQQEVPLPPQYKYIHEILPQGSWKGHRCWIVAGGPSIKGMDLGFLKGELVIGINRAYEICDPAVLLCMDQRLWGWIVKGELGEESKAKFDAFTGVKCWSVLNKLPSLIPFDEGYFLHSRPEVALSDNLETGIHWGCHGGYAALNLAILLGADPIYLLGYDMNSAKDKEGVERKAWWHEGYPNDGQKPTVYANFIKDFVTHKEVILVTKRDIVNLNPNSGLKVFRRSTLEDEKVVPVRRPLVICFHTHPDYAAIAKKMEMSVRRFGLEVEVSNVESKGSWLRNVQYKAEFILSKLVEHKRDVVWLDADSIVNSYPTLFDNFEGDIGVHICDWKRHTGGKREQKELLGAVMYCRYNPRTIAFLKTWVKAVEAEPIRYEQLTLQHKLADYPKSKGLVLQELPAEYCTIYDTMIDVEKPVIEQFQASRFLRNIV